MTDVQPTRAPADRRRLFALTALWAIAVVVYLVLARRTAAPITNPDEFLYGHLARSVADGDGLSWRGQDIALHAALYVYAIAPAWLGDSTTHAYTAAKSAGAVLLCLAALPTWIVARRFVAPGLAVLCALMTVAGSWMMTSGLILTENLAFPLATAALAATVVAVAHPGGRSGWLALGVAVLAAWARLQCVALVAVLFGALVIAAVAGAAPARRRLREDRWLVLLTGSASIGGAVVAFAKPSVLGIYSDIAHFSPSISDLLAAFGHQSVGLVAMAGFVPVLVVLAASTSRAAWRDPAAGPVMAVTCSAAAVFVLQSGWSLSGLAEWHIQRYVEYVLPVLFLAALVIVERRLISGPRLAGATIAVAGLLLFAPPIRQVLEERAAWAISLRLDDLLGADTPVALALTTVFAGVLALLALRADRRFGDAARAAILVGAVTLGIFAIQDQAGWSWQSRVAKATRSGFPADLQWIDHAGDGPVARLVVVASPWRWRITEFFNRTVTQVYALRGARTAGVRGTICRWGIGASGAITFAGPCGSIPRRFYTDDEYARVRFYDQKLEAISPVVGRVVSVPSRPRVKSVLYVNCSPPTPSLEYGGRGSVAAPVSRCVPAMQAEFWLDASGTLALTFRGDSVDHLITAGSRSYTLAPNRVTTIRIPVPKGASVTPVTLDWTGPTPRLVGAQLVQGPLHTSVR